MPGSYSTSFLAGRPSCPCLNCPHVHTVPASGRRAVKGGRHAREQARAGARARTVQRHGVLVPRRHLDNSAVSKPVHLQQPHLDRRLAAEQLLPALAHLVVAHGVHLAFVCVAGAGARRRARGGASARAAHRSARSQSRRRALRRRSSLRPACPRRAASCTRGPWSAGTWRWCARSGWRRARSSSPGCAAASRPAGCRTGTGRRRWTARQTCPSARRT